MQFNMSEAWRDATAMITANREVLLVVAGIFFLLPSLVIAFVTPALQESLMADPENMEKAMEAMISNWGVLLFVGIFAMTLFQIVGYLAMLALLRDTSRPTVAEALKAGLVGMLPALGYYLLLGFGLFAAALVVGMLMALNVAIGVVAILLLVVVGIYVMIKLSLTLAVIAIDKVGNPITAMSRSWAMTKGNSLSLFGFFLLLGVVYVVIATVVGLIVGALTLAAGPTVGLWVNALISGVLSVVVTVVLVAVIAATHRQLSGAASAVGATFE